MSARALSHEPALTALKRFVQARFGARVRALSLFGSYARGEAHEDSECARSSGTGSRCDPPEP